MFNRVLNSPLSSCDMAHDVSGEFPLFCSQRISELSFCYATSQYAKLTLQFHVCNY